MNNHSTNNKKTILLGFADALSAPEAVWSSVDHGFSVIVFSRHGSKPPLRRFKKIKIVEVCPPEIDVNQTINDLKNIINITTPDILMPLDDKSVWLCSTIVPETDIKIAGPTGLQADIALDKRLQIEAAARAGLRVIPTRHMDTREELMQINEFPILLKPATAVVKFFEKLIVGAHYTCTSKIELSNVTQLWEESYPMMAQPIIDGIGEGIFGLATDNGVTAWSAHRRIRMMNPRGSGSSACESLPITDQPIDSIEQMLIKIKWRGIFMVELIRDKFNQLWFMEMNGRPWGSMALARRGGYEYPLWSVLYALDINFRPESPNKYKAIVCRHLGREILHILMVLRGPQSSAIKDWPSLGKTLSDVLRVKRNHTWYNWQSGEALFFIEDTYRTVFDTFRKKVRAS